MCIAFLPHGTVRRRSKAGSRRRVFVNYPHWGDDMNFTVAEIKNGRAVLYPNALVNKLDPHHPGQCLESV